MWRYAYISSLRNEQVDLYVKLEQPAKWFNVLNRRTIETAN